MRGITRALALGLVLALRTACGTGDRRPGLPTVAESQRDEARTDLSTYQYAIQTKGKIRIGTQEDNTPFSVKTPATSKWDGFDVAIGREIAKAIFGEAEDVEKFIEWVPVVSATRIPAITDNKPTSYQNLHDQR